MVLQSSEDFSQQLLPHLLALRRGASEPFARARAAFEQATLPLRPTAFPKSPASGGWAASPAQQRVNWLEVGYARSQAAAGSTIAAGYNIQTTVPLDAATQTEDVRASFAALLRTHAVARASLVPSGADGGTVTIAIADSCAADVTELAGSLDDVARRELLAQFDLATPPLMRVAVVRAPDGGKALLVTAHQAMFDERSLRHIAGAWQKPAAAVDADTVSFVSYASWIQVRV